MKNYTKTWRQWINTAAVVFATVAALYFSSSFQRNVIPFGCDNFGYARQAQLFRTQGWIRGLDTTVETPQSQLLISLAERSLPNDGAWYQLIAPNCHHVDPHNGKIILQYPPGTGFLLSLFPEPYAMPYQWIVGSLLVASFITWIAIGHKLSILAALSLIGSTFLLFWILSSQVLYWSSISIPPTLFFLPFATWFAHNFPRTSKSTTLFLGIIAGTLIDIRLTNALILVGFMVQAAVQAKLRSWLNVKTHAAQISFAAYGVALGVLPTLIANKINTGGYFRTTYSPIDATAPLYSWQLIADRLAFYFETPLGSPTLIVGICFLILGVIVAVIKKEQRVIAATLGALVTILVSLLFFATHAIAAMYYMIPPSVTAAFMVSFAIIRSNEMRSRSWSYLTIIPFLGWAFWMIGRTTPFTLDIKLPSEVSNEKSIIWADNTNGTIYYYTGRYASEFVSANQLTQDKLIDAVRNAGYSQYFVIDSDKILKLCSHEASRHGVTDAGIGNVFGTRKIWKIDPIQVGPQMKCASIPIR